jgi:hypothetical protein
VALATKVADALALGAGGRLVLVAATSTPPGRFVPLSRDVAGPTVGTAVEDGVADGVADGAEIRGAAARAGAGMVGAPTVDTSRGTAPHARVERAVRPAAGEPVVRTWTVPGAFDGAAAGSDGCSSPERVSHTSKSATATPTVTSAQRQGPPGTSRTPGGAGGPPDGRAAASRRERSSVNAASGTIAPASDERRVAICASSERT